MQLFTLFDVKIYSFENFRLNEAFMNIFKSYHFLSEDNIRKLLLFILFFYISSRYAI